MPRQNSFQLSYLENGRGNAVLRKFYPIIRKKLVQLSIQDLDVSEGCALGLRAGGSGEHCCDQDYVGGTLAPPAAVWVRLTCSLIHDGKYYLLLYHSCFYTIAYCPILRQ